VAIIWCCLRARRSRYCARSVTHRRPRLLSPSNRHGYRPTSENAIGNLPHRAGYPGSHVPHGFRAAFSTVMNEWAQRNGKGHDRRILDRMRGHGLREPMITRRI
jgi:hypothetical protein